MIPSLRTRADAVLMPTARDVIHREGTVELYRFRGDKAPDDDAPVVLLVPSLINQWYVLDLRDGHSVAQACVDAGFDTYCLNWGEPNDEDRYLEWEAVLHRLGRVIRRVKRFAGTDQLGVLGYCVGGTLTSIYAALHPDEIAALINLAGPIDFSHAGHLGLMTDRRWFDAAAIAEAGNVSPEQMQSGFVAMRPMGQITKWMVLGERGHNPDFFDAFAALDTWANDNVAFPAAAYRTYIEDLYQDNLLVKGEHRVGGQAVDLAQINCPTLTVATDADHICPEPAARGLHEAVSSDDKEIFIISGGHVGAVVGSRGPRKLYPKVVEWFGQRLGTSAAESPRQ